MREIKFRGISLETDEWIVGGFYKSKRDRTTYIVEDITGSVIGIRSNTLTEFTGLLDKNGNAIYEGDILTAQGSRENGENVDIKGDVKFNGAFMVNSILLYMLSNLEVIGNIYENPNLLN